MVQAVKHPTFGFLSGHDLRVMGSSPASGSRLGMEVAWDFSLSFSLSLFSNPKEPLQSSGGGCQDHKQWNLPSAVPVPLLEGPEAVHWEWHAVCQLRMGHGLLSGAGCYGPGQGEGFQGTCLPFHKLLGDLMKISFPWPSVTKSKIEFYRISFA